MRGDRYCIICNQYLGNYLTGFTPDGERSFHSLIRVKYCDICRPMIKSQQAKLRLHNLHERRKQEKKQELSNLDLLREENELLRKYVSELRQQLEQLKSL